jgi:hypothetical protein
MPLAEFAPELTPYRYAFNSPMMYIDPFGLFETKAAAKEYAKENGIKTGWFRSNKIVENKESDGSTFYSIDNKKEGSSISDLGGDLGVKKGSLSIDQKINKSSNADSRRIPISSLDLVMMVNPMLGATKSLGTVSKSITNSLKPIGLGSTGRTEAANILEQMTMKEAMANPQNGKEVMTGMNDLRWFGWSKMQYSIETKNGVKPCSRIV